ncbi:hypothetical protein [Halopseudomonas sp.]|uniref:hypothetical protein n=1 Tax=Halopseudomonas sp. TaxID=2901191 RepID=UPI000C0D72BE|nr:hypothetical protein [Pseudomonas sp.]PHR10624.1 MAG: hypothetical protein COA41_20725 [Sphingopyxis sp.]
MQKGRYYLGRVVKINLDQERLIGAIKSSPTITVGKFDWTITDVVHDQVGKDTFVFGKLAKYAREGHAKVIDEDSRSQVDADVPNLLEASSSFVYLPSCSGIAFLHVWNGIQEDVFPRRFKSVIEAAFDSFFIACDVEPVSDYRAFTTRLKKLNYFIELSATVYPPNPLFGRLWSSLNDYIERRNASEVTVKEQSSKVKGLNSNIIGLMDHIMETSDYIPSEAPAIADAAILMAADGYGRGKVVGIEDGGDEVVIKTSDTQKSFLYSKEPIPFELAVKAKNQFDKISTDRDMRH